MKLRCRAPIAVSLFVMTAALPAFATGAAAQERTDFKEEFNNVMSVVGFGKDRDVIDYTARAPIVVPPSNDLPSPAEGRPARAAGFPDDPDVTARRKALVDPRQPVPPTDSGRTTKTRAYLIEPPAAYFDASAVAATGKDVDKGDAPTAAPKHVRKRRAQADAQQ